jgi:hypothetical protein
MQPPHLLSAVSLHPPSRQSRVRRAWCHAATNGETLSDRVRTTLTRLLPHLCYLVKRILVIGRVRIAIGAKPGGASIRLSASSSGISSSVLAVVAVLSGGQVPPYTYATPTGRDHDDVDGADPAGLRSPTRSVPRRPEKVCASQRRYSSSLSRRTRSAMCSAHNPNACINSQGLPETPNRSWTPTISKSSGGAKSCR